MSRSIKIDWTSDLIRGVDAILNYIPKDKSHSGKDNTPNKLNNGDIHPINEINSSSKNLVSIEKLTFNQQDSASKEDLSSFIKEDNE